MVYQGSKLLEFVSKSSGIRLDQVIIIYDLYLFN